MVLNSKCSLHKNTLKLTQEDIVCKIPRGCKTKRGKKSLSFVESAGKPIIKFCEWLHNGKIGF